MLSQSTVKMNRLRLPLTDSRIFSVLESGGASMEFFHSLILTITNVENTAFRLYFFIFL